MKNLKTENIEDIYKTILSQEISNHNVFITVLLAIVVILLGATWWFNKHGAKKTIQQEVKRQLKIEKAKLEKVVNKKIRKKIKRTILDYEIKMIVIEADVSRSMALLARKDELWPYSIYWFTKYLDLNMQLGEEETVRETIQWIIDEINELEKMEAKEKKKDKKESEWLYGIHEYEYVVSVIEDIPDILTKEREILLASLDQRMEVI